MMEKKNFEVTAKERREIFHETYDASVDASLVLAGLVREAGNYLAQIVGTNTVDAAFEKIVEGLAQVSGEAGDWRDTLDRNSMNCFSEWPLGARLHDLAAYAYFGIALTQEDDSEGWLGGLVSEAMSFWERSPVSEWLFENEDHLLETLVLLAEGRWNLDHGRAVDPKAIAIFGKVSDGRIRNMMSGKERTFTNKDGLIPAHEALAWLADRDSFWNSIWQDQETPLYLYDDRPPLSNPVFVPVARDGSVFHPGLKRSGNYTIGEKTKEQHVSDFEAALLSLQKMPAPYWRRPNDTGAWGIVRGVHWERMDWSDLEAFIANPSQRLHVKP